MKRVTCRKEKWKTQRRHVLKVIFTLLATLGFAAQVHGLVNGLIELAGRPHRFNKETVSQAKDFDEETRKKLKKIIENMHRETREALIEAVGRSDFETKEAFPGLIKVLADKDMDRSVRSLAIRTLGKISRSFEGDPIIKEKIIPALIQILKSKNEDFIRITLEALGDIGAAAVEAVPVIFEVLKDVKWTAESAYALRRIGKPSVFVLIEAAGAQNSVVREFAVYNLGELAHSIKEDPIVEEKIIPNLIMSLEDKEWIVRKAAAVALGKSGFDSKGIIDGLVKALRDDASEVRSSSVNALQKIGQPAIPALIEALEDENRLIREYAGRVLGEIAESSKDIGIINEKIVPALINRLSDREEWVRYYAVAALAKMGKPAIPALVAALEQESALARESAINALGLVTKSIKDDPIVKERIVPALIRMLKDVDWNVRGGVVNALGLVTGSIQGDPIVKERIVPVLVRVLKDENWNVRGGAALALGEMGPFAVGAIRALIDASREKDWRVRGVILGSLGKIGAPLKQNNIVKEQIYLKLLEGLRDGEWMVRGICAETLGEFGDNRAVRPLGKIAEGDPNDEVRKAAREAAEKLTGGVKKR